MTSPRLRHLKARADEAVQRQRPHNAMKARSNGNQREQVEGEDCNRRNPTGQPQGKEAKREAQRLGRGSAE